MSRSVVSLCMLCLIAVAVAAEEQATADPQPTDRYDAEALRVKWSFFGSSIVQGRDEQRVAGLSFYPGDVDFLSQRDDDIGRHFRSFRKKRKISATLYLLGAAALVGAIDAGAGDAQADAGQEEGVVGAGVAVGGAGGD